MDLALCLRKISFRLVVVVGCGVSSWWWEDEEMAKRWPRVVVELGLWRKYRWVKPWTERRWRWR